MFRPLLIARPFGVEVRLHWTLLAFAGFLALASLVAGGAAAAASTVALLVCLLGSVTLHELGHIGAARLFGIGTTGVTLYPFGGLARLTREARTPTEEVVVALAGPAVNVLLAGLAAIPTALFGTLPLVHELMLVNAVLAVFNLVPAFPMDGGRVLRGALWPRLGYRRATTYAARAGQGIAVLFGLVGLFTSVMLVVIAGFVFLQATAELGRLQLGLSGAGPAATHPGLAELFGAEPPRPSASGPSRAGREHPFFASPWAHLRRPQDSAASPTSGVRRAGREHPFFASPWGHLRRQRSEVNEDRSGAAAPGWGSSPPPQPARRVVILRTGPWRGGVRPL